MVPPSELWSMTATEILSMIKNGHVTVEEYAQALLSRIESRDNVVKAWQYLDSEIVLSQARAVDQIPPDQRGRLHGVAISIKDIMDTKDMPTEYGSPLYKHHRPGADCSPVDILRRAGALIFGKTTTTEFAVLNSGPETTNPRDPTLPLSCGTQTGGSVIRPAAYTGIYAKKPTFNAISGQGIKVFCAEFDTFGYFARSMEDLKLLTDVFRDTADGPVKDIPLHEAKVGLLKTPFWPSAGPGTIAAMTKAVEVLRNHRVVAEDVELPSEYSDATVLKNMFNVILKSDGHASFLKDYLRDTTKTKLDPEIRSQVEDAQNVPRDEVRRAFDYFAAMRLSFDQIADRYTVLVTPSATDEAPLGLGDMGDANFNFLWTGVRMPVIHIPAFVGPNRMPVGLSVVARRFCDQYLLNVASLLAVPFMNEGGWQESQDEQDAC